MTSEPTSENETEVESREPTKRPPLRVIVIVASISLAALLILAWYLLKGAGARSAASTSEPVTGMQTVTVSRVVSKDVDRQLKLPGELNAYQDVAVFPKVQGFVKEIKVDRGSVVKR